MKKLVFLLSIVSILACNKKNTLPVAKDSGFDGTWKMIEVTDMSTNITEPEPAGADKHVIINFTHDSDMKPVYWGQTPFNEISNSSFEIDTDKNLHILSLNMTKVLDEPWFEQFADHIRSATHFDFAANGNIRIYTDSKILIFEGVNVGML